MRLGVAGELVEWLQGLRATGGWRGLVVLHSSDVFGSAARLAGLLAEELGGQGACVAPVEGRAALRGSGGCGRVYSPSAIQELLGSENRFVVLAVPGLLRPNLVAAAAETVRAGGVAALVAPPLPLWSPGGGQSIGAYKRYLVNSFYRARSIFWACLDRGVVYASRLPRGRASPPPGPQGYRARSPLPRALVEAAATLEQAERLDEVAGFLRRRGRGVLVLGDRGRGKSGLLGLVVAYLIHSHMAGFVSVTGPSVWGVQSFFRVLDRALGLLGVRHWRVEKHGVVVGVAGPWFHVRYHTPDQAQPGPYTVVDEAAALGPSRLRVFAARSPRLLAATTIHGYEGSGRVLAHVVEKVIPAPRLVVELSTPVRYPPGDPLEDWVYTTFMLRAEPGPPPSLGGEPRVVEVDRHRLADDPDLLGKLYAILVEAHYRNEPDDLALILDAPHHRLYALLAGGEPVAVADVAEESPETPWEARILLDKLAEAAGYHRVGRGWRVVRIAVHPGLQRRGLGSRLLRGIEEEARARGLDWLGAIYGRVEVTRFWLSNGFLPVYASPLPNRVTGEHNIGVAKGLSSGGSDEVAEAAARLLAGLLWGGGSLYRSLPPEVYAELLTGVPGLEERLPRVELAGAQAAELARAAAGQGGAEAAVAALAAAAEAAAGLYGGLWMLDERERLVLAARVLQGRSLRELRHLGIDAPGLAGLLRGLAATLLQLVAWGPG